MVGLVGLEFGLIGDVGVLVGLFCDVEKGGVIAVRGIETVGVGIGG